MADTHDKYLRAPRGGSPLRRPSLYLRGALCGAALLALPAPAQAETPPDARAGAAPSPLHAPRAGSSDLAYLLTASAEALGHRLSHPGHTVPRATDCRSAEKALPDEFERATFEAGCSATRGRFEHDTSFSHAQFDGPLELQSAEFSGLASFQWATFNATAELQYAVFHSDVDLYSSVFAGQLGLFGARFEGPATFQGARLRGRVDLTNAELRGGSSFYQAEFGAEASFHGAELLRVADFSGVVFRGPVDFSRAKFGERATFARADFSGPASFLDARLPKVLDLSDLTKIDGVLDLTKAAPPSFGQKCQLNLARSDLEKINIDFDTCRLYFPEGTSDQDILDVYEGLLASFERRGLQKSMREATIELQQYKYARDGRWLMNAVQSYWWDYGFEKQRIFLWIGVLIGLFTIINNFFFGWLLENAYEVTFLLPYVKKRPPGLGVTVRFVLDLPLAFLYTGIIFFGSLFGFRRELSHFKSHRILVNLYLFFIMASGIVCTMFILNYLLK